MTTPEAKPCPFCGSIACLSGSGEFRSVRCGRCGAEGPDYNKSDDDAIAAWNRRTEGPAGAATASPEHDSPLLAFVRQSNAIEGITRPPTKPEVEAHKRLLSLGVVEVADLEEFVRVCADARLRRGPGMDVRVGPHLPPRGGPQIEISLRELLADIQEGALSPWKAHVRYETLHPFMDGNGRSGRALWLWQMRGIQNVRQPLGFLHAFYYQTLQGSRS